MTSRLRTVLFFAPHLALVLIALHGDHVRSFLAVSAVLPWWCRFVGRPWRLDRRFVLGPVLAVAGYVGLAIAMIFIADLVSAATVLVFTLFFTLYSFFVFEWKRQRPGARTE